MRVLQLAFVYQQLVDGASVVRGQDEDVGDSYCG
jgi:hypothetical protein